MTTTTPRKLLAALLVFCLTLGFLPVPARAAEAVAYYDPASGSQTCTEYTVLDGTAESWSGGWYVVPEGGLTIRTPVTVTGSVNLILRDGTTLTFDENAGVTVNTGGSLTLWAQSAGSDAGTVTGSGSDDLFYVSGGSMTVAGGSISASGGSAIGADSGSTVTFLGGSVHSSGSSAISLHTSVLKVGGDLSGIESTGYAAISLYESTIEVIGTLTGSVSLGLADASITPESPYVFTSGLSGKGSVSNFSLESDLLIGETLVLGSSGGEAAIGTENFTVTFYSDEGQEYTTQSVISGGMAAAPEEDPSKAHFVFGGWQLDGTPFDFEESQIMGATAIFAGWTAKTQVTVPTIASKTYTGETLTADVSNTSDYTVTTNAGGIAVNGYNVVLTLTDPAGCEWSDGDENAAKTLTFEITAAAATAPTVPTLNAVTYDPAKTLNDVTLSGGWAWSNPSTVPTVSVSSYEAYYAVTDYTNYDWSDVDGYDEETHRVVREIALTVNKATVTVPTIASKTYTGETLTADVSNTSDYTVTANAGGIAVNGYNVVLTLTDPDNCEWSDGDENAAKTLTFEITAAAATEPTVPTLNAVTYDPAKTLNDVTLSGGWVWTDPTVVPTVAVSSYEAYYTVSDYTNYDWSDVTGYDEETHRVVREIALTVNKASVAIPAIASKTYTGETLTADVSNTSDYTVTANAGGIAVNSYNVVLTLTDPDNCEWSDGDENAAKTLTFEITAAAATEPTVPTLNAVTYDPAKTLNDVTLSGGWAWADPTVVPTVAVSSYEAYYTVSDYTNYDWSDVTGYDEESHRVVREIALTVNKASVAVPTIASKTYTGETLTADVSNTSDYTVTANAGGIAVGGYDVVLTLTDPAGCEWSDGDENAAKTLTFEITAAAATEPTVPTLNAVTYDPAKTLNDVTLSGGWAWSDLTVVPTVAVSSYEAYYTVSDYTNYDWSDVTGYDEETHRVVREIALTVNKASVTIPTIASKTYTGETLTADVSNTSDYTVTANAGGIAVNSYNVVLTLTDPDNCEWSDGDENAAKTLTFEITAAAATEPTVPTLNAVTYDPAKTLNDVTLSGGWAWADPTVVPTVAVSSYEAYYAVTDYTNYDWSDVTGYDEETHRVVREIALTVNKASVTVPTIASKTYTGETLTADVSNTSDYTVTANAGGIAVNSYDVVLTLTDPDNCEWSDGDENAAKTLTFEITAAAQDAPNVGYTDETLDGKHDGTITGLTTAMEYSRNGKDYTAVTGTELTGLEPGTYYVRCAADANHTASEATEVTISAGRKIIVTWSINGETSTSEYSYTAVPSYPGPAPAKAADAQYTYSFAGWKTGEITYAPTQALPGVIGDITYTAQFDQTARTYGAPVWTWTGDDEHGYTAASAAFTTNDGAAVFTETVEAGTPDKVHTDPTCTESGSDVYTATVTFGGETYTDKKTVTLSALGHTWGTPTYEWAADNSTVTAKRVCGTDATHIETETVNTTSEVTKAATCDAMGETTYTATFENTAFSTQTKTVENVNALGHKWGTPTYEWAADNSTVTAKRVCGTDATHIETETVNTTSEVTKAATCDAKGETTYTATFENTAFTTQNKTVENVDALGHTWGTPTYEWAADNSTVTAKRVCGTDATHIETETVNTTSEVTKAATCDAKGETTYTAAFTNTAFTTQTKTVENVNALGHTWGTPAYEWAADNSTVTAKRICGTDATHIETETVNTTSEVTKAATCDAKGETTYTATFENIAFATQTKTVENVDALGHTWGTPTYEWATDNSTVTAKRICGTDATHIETETVNTTSEVTKAATCDAKGETTYTATFTNTAFATQTKTVENVDALGHKWGTPTYEWAADNSTVTAKRVCGTDATHIETETVNTTSEVTKAATCDAKGETTYTATFTNTAFATQTKTLENVNALGHTWGEPAWNWTEDEETGVHAAATFVCENDPAHTETVEAEVREEETEDGILYLAAVFFDGETYTDTRPAKPEAVLYTIRFVNEDGALLSETQYEKGTPAEKIVRPVEPTKASTALYSYLFAGWVPEITAVDRDATYTATFTAVQIPQSGGGTPAPAPGPAPDPSDSGGWRAPQEEQPGGSGSSGQGENADGYSYGEELEGNSWDLYRDLVWGSDTKEPERFLIEDEPFQLLNRDGPPVSGQNVIEAEEHLLNEIRLLAEGDPAQPLPLKTELLYKEELNKVDPNSADKSVNYGSLKPGDLVRTAKYNGIYVSSLPKSGNANYESELQKARDDIIASFHAFDRDHPEVFWLTSQIKVRVVTVTVNSVQTAYLFFVLADEKGFTLRDAAYSTTEKINADAKVRDEAVQKILAEIPADGTPKEKVTALNRWLTTHNEYNTTADLNTIGTAPHRCLSALLGSTGTKGPVCDGYSRAFKVICDKLGIPCILVTGYARTSAEQKEGEYHMWNSVQMADEKWYGADITWNDPKVIGVSGAVSGQENENFLLVGGATVVQGLAFQDSHQPSTKIVEGASFNAPILSQVAFSNLTLLPFLDLPENAYYYDAVVWALQNGVTNGTSRTTFSPDAVCTRAQVVTFLWRAAGSPEPVSAVNPFTDVDPDAYYCKPVLWALEQGITNGTSETTFTPGGTCSYAHILTFLYRAIRPGKTAADYPDPLGTGTWYEDSLTWASHEALLPGGLSAAEEGFAQRGCPRRDVVYTLWRVLAQ